VQANRTKKLATDGILRFWKRIFRFNDTEIQPSRIEGVKELLE